MSDDTSLSPWQRIAKKALEQIPQVLVAALAALVLFSAGLLLDHRDHAHAIADLQPAVEGLRDADVALGTNLPSCPPPVFAAPSASRPETSSSTFAIASPTSKARWVWE